MANKKQKSAVAYSLFAIFLGCFGVHKFYAGKIGLGLTMLFLFLGGLTSYIIAAACAAAYEYELAGFFAFIGSVLVLGISIWAFVDFIIGLCHIGNPQKLFK